MATRTTWFVRGTYRVSRPHKSCLVFCSPCSCTCNLNKNKVIFLTTGGVIITDFKTLNFTEDIFPQKIQSKKHPTLMASWQPLSSSWPSWFSSLLLWSSSPRPGLLLPVDSAAERICENSWRISGFPARRTRKPPSSCAFAVWNNKYSLSVLPLSSSNSSS